MPLKPSADATETLLSDEGLPSSRFWVEVNGMMEAVFSECSGLVATTEVMTVKEGGTNDHVYQLPVRTTYSNVTLKHGVGLSDVFWTWYASTVAGKPDKRTVTILLYSPGKTDVPRKAWTLNNAYPVKWTGPNFGSKSSEFAMESLELAYEWFKPAPDRTVG